MKRTLSTTYDLKWELKDAPHYKFTADGKCINGKFVSANALRPRLQKIERITCPF